MLVLCAGALLVSTVTRACWAAGARSVSATLTVHFPPRVTRAPDSAGAVPEPAV